MEAHETVQMILAVGARYSMDLTAIGLLPLKVIATNVKFVSREALWKKRFGDDAYVHWDLLKQLPHGKNALGGCSEWLGMLSFCAWGDLSKVETDIANNHHPLAVLRYNMRACSLDTGDKDAWTLACRVFVLTLVQGLPCLAALELLTCAHFKRSTRAGCVELLAMQAESLFTPEQYEATLSLVLERCTVDTPRLEQTLALVRAAQEDKKLGLALSRMQVVQGRPRLRDRVASVLKTDERKAQVDTMLDTWESYTGFCYKHQFPPTLSERIKSRLYFLASQTRWDWRQHVQAVLPGGGKILEKVRAHPITQPDLPAILRVLESLGMDGAPPFRQMTAFQTACFQSFPVVHVQRMTLSQVSARMKPYPSPSKSMMAP